MLESDNPVLPAFLTTDDYVPGAFRDLLSEADGCLQKGFLTGGTACARRALDLLLSVAKTEGATYEERLQSLGDKHGIAKMLTSILVQCGGASAKENATLSVEVLQLFIVTMKAVVYELYVVGPDRTIRLQYVSGLVTSVGRKPAGENGAGQSSDNGVHEEPLGSETSGSSGASDTASERSKAYHRRTPAMAASSR
jgi:hypothetical protein